MLRKEGDTWQVLGDPQGIERLGGVDFDEAVFQHIVAATDGVVTKLAIGGAAARRGGRHSLGRWVVRIPLVAQMVGAELVVVVLSAVGAAFALGGSDDPDSGTCTDLP